MKHIGKIALMVLITLAFVLQLLINQRIGPEGNVVEAFSSTELIPVEACVSAYGDFGDMELTEETRRAMLKNLAGQLGITDGYAVTATQGDSFQESTLTKDGKYGKTVLQIVSLKIGENGESEGAGGSTGYQQMILSDITIYDNPDYMMQCKETLEDIYRSVGMTPEVGIYVKGKTAGALSERGRQKITDSIFEQLHAETVQEIHNENYDCVYGYTEWFEHSIKQNGRKINLNLAFTYQEEEDITYLHLAVPYIRQSF